MGCAVSLTAARESATVPEEPHLPTATEVEVSSRALGWWNESGGAELEGVLRSGAIALLDARWVVELAEAGGVLRPRQALPDEAFLSLSQIQEAMLLSKWHSGLPIVCVSHCWLQPDHPDPRGHNLRMMAKGLKSLLEFRCNRTVAVFYDFCSIHQKCRSADGTPQGLSLIHI